MKSVPLVYVQQSSIKIWSQHGKWPWKIKRVERDYDRNRDRQSKRG